MDSIALPTNRLMINLASSSRISRFANTRPGCAMRAAESLPPASRYCFCKSAMCLAPAVVGTHGLMRPCRYHLPSWQAGNCPGRRRPAARMAARQSAQRRRELVGRVPHVRDAPPSVHPERSGGQRTARPTNPVVTERAPEGAQ